MAFHALNQNGGHADHGSIAYLKYREFPVVYTVGTGYGRMCDCDTAVNYCIFYFSRSVYEQRHNWGCKRIERT